MERTTSIVIIGGGAVGCATAYELSGAGCKNIVLLERNDSLTGINQSMRNAGVIHSGMYYPQKTEPLKSQLCVEGNRLIYEFCKTHGVPHKNVGKLVIATNSREEEYLDYLLETGNENGVLGLRKIDAIEMKKIEPNVTGTCAVYAPTSGVVDLHALFQTYSKLLSEKGVVTFLSANVTAIQSKSGGFDITVGNGQTYHADTVINAAGLYSDDIAKMVNPLSPYIIEPVRGELVCYAKTDTTGIRMNIYQSPYGYYNDTAEKANVPIETFHQLMELGVVTRTVGVHLTPTFGSDGHISSTVAVGPLKTVGQGKEDYTTGQKPMEKYIEKVHHFFPNVKAEELKPYYTGIMAVLPHHRDFVIERDRVYPNLIHCIGIDSPGLTASLAIGKYIKNLF